MNAESIFDLIAASDGMSTTRLTIVSGLSLKQCRYRVQLLREAGRILSFHNRHERVWCVAARRDELQAMAQSVRQADYKAAQRVRDERKLQRLKASRAEAVAERKAKAAERQAAKEAQKRAAIPKATRYAWRKVDAWTEPAPPIPSIWHYAERMAA